MTEGQRQRVGSIIADLAGSQMRLEELMREAQRQPREDFFDSSPEALEEASTMLDDVIDLLREL